MVQIYKLLKALHNGSDIYKLLKALHNGSDTEGPAQ